MIFARTILCIVSILLVSIQSRAASRAQVSRRDANTLDQAQPSSNKSIFLRSPSPEDYQDLYQFACGVDRNGSKTPASRDELIKHYSQTGNERLRQVVESYNIYKECRREPTAWRYKYIDEDGLVLLSEHSIDERAANVLYLTRSVKPFVVDLFSYDWQDPALDRANMDRVTGPKFDDELCGKQLAQMLDLIKELRERSKLLRSNSTRWSTSLDHRLTDQQISLAKILDSYGRHESGRLLGKIYAPGSYLQCLWDKLILSEDDSINMRYCWAHMSYEHHLTASLRQRQRAFHEYPLNVLYTGVCLPESCHSKSFARHKDLLQKLIDTQFEQPAEYVDEHLNITSLYCIVDDESDYRIPLAGKCLLASICGWCLTTILVTVYNRKMGLSSIWQEQRRRAKTNNPKRKPEREHPFLRSLDLNESWQDFQEYYSSPSLERPVQLDAMNFFKVFGCSFVVVGHTMALYAGSSMDEIRLSRYIETDSVLCLIVAGTLVVDTFFVISGILWAYFALKRLNKPQPAPKRSENIDGIQLQANISRAKPSIVIGQADELKSRQADEGSLFNSRVPEEPANLMEEANQANYLDLTIIGLESWPETIKTFCSRWFVFSLARYLRIVPLFALVHWFKKYVFMYIGTGPFWDHGLNYGTMTGACQKETPLTPFTFMSAYYPIARQCTLQSWSISNDLFFALIAPPVILLINKRPKVAAWLTFVSCLASYYFAMDKLNSFPDYVDEELRELRTFGFYRIFDQVSILYTAPHLRVFCFLIGVWGGYALYCGQEKLEKRRTRCELEGHRETDNSDQEQIRLGPPVQMSGGQANHDKASRERIKWPSWLRFATLLSCVYIICVFASFGFNQSTKIFISGLYRFIYPQFATGIRILWALANVVLFIRMTTDWKNTLLMRWSASKFWQASSKLCLAILLIHFDLLLYTINVQTTLQTSFTKWAFLNLGSGILLMCVPLAILIHVVYEMPLDKLIRSRFAGL